MLISSAKVQVPEFSSSEISSAVSKVRKISKHVLHSDKILRNLKRKTHLSPIIDCKTRWDSLLDMLTRFVTIQRELNYVYVDLNKEWEIDHKDMQMVKILVAILEPCKTFVGKMSVENRNLVFADKAAAEMIEKIQIVKEKYAENSFIANFLHQLKLSFAQRRTELSDILLYLCKDRINLQLPKFQKPQMMLQSWT